MECNKGVSSTGSCQVQGQLVPSTLFFGGSGLRSQASKVISMASKIFSLAYVWTLLQIKTHSL